MRRRAAPGVPTEFHVADVLEYTRGAPDCDLILASFSLHHLDTAAKGDLLKAAYQRLVRAVMFLCCDGCVIVRRVVSAVAAVPAEAFSAVCLQFSRACCCEEFRAL